MGNLKDVIYLSNEDYETLVSTGTVTIDGETLTYDANNIYITPDESSGGGGVSLYRHAISFTDNSTNTYRFELISEKSTKLTTVAEVVGVMRGAILPIPGIDISGNYDFIFKNNKLNSIVHVEQMGPYYLLVGYTYISGEDIMYDSVDLTDSASTSVDDTVTEFVTGDPLTE